MSLGGPEVECYGLNVPPKLILKLNYHCSNVERLDLQVVIRSCRFSPHE